MKAIATACANIALVKYWGKKDPSLNTPARGSLSVTLEALATTTEVELGGGAEDRLVLGGVERIGRELGRVNRFLDRVRSLAGSDARASVRSVTTFPIAAGLASSASGFAALAVAASRAFGLDLDPRALSQLARQGSGSAARSIFGGFVRMHAGHLADGSDAYAEPIQRVAPRLELRAAIAVARAKEKAVGSTEGMERSRITSPYHGAWLELVDRDLAAAEAALSAGDFDRLAEIAEGSCLAMHADAMAARPGIVYFNAATCWAIERVRALRQQGVPVFFTIDAGPHLVAFTTPSELARVRDALGAYEGIERVISSKVGPGASLVDAPIEEERP